ncbi:MAG: abortive infection family protein, partial [Mobilitalea sp.]
FLNRLFKLKELPSTDSRYKDAESDIWKHTVANDDWENGWVFNDRRFELYHGNDDEILLTFLSEIFHPAVRNEKQPWTKFLNKLNELLKIDGYEICEKDHISGRKVYGWREIQSGQRVVDGQIDNIKQSFNTNYVSIQVDLMYELINTAPHSAIGKAKELLEICCKTILDERHIKFNSDLDLNQLMRTACESIDLSPKKLKEGVKGQDIAGRILGNLANISHGMAELRNLYGDGHGKNKDFQPLPPRYAHLAVGASVAAVHFMWDTYQERIKS